VVVFHSVNGTNLKPQWRRLWFDVKPRKHRKVRKSSVVTRRPASNLRIAGRGDWSVADQSDGLLTVRLYTTLLQGLLATEHDDANFLWARTRIGLPQQIHDSQLGNRRVQKSWNGYNTMRIKYTLNILLSLDSTQPQITNW